MLRICANQAETSLSCCGHTCTELGIGSVKKGRTKKFVKGGKFLLFVMVDREISTF